MYIVLDTETGGIGSEYSLLSYYVGLYDDNFNLKDDLNQLVRPDNGIYNVCGEAMSVNKINLVEHEKLSIPYKKASSSLYATLSGWFNNFSNKQKMIVVGHNVKGDIDGICRNLISRGSWETFVSYRVLDTASVGMFLKACGLIPSTVSGSLVSYAEYFGIPSDQQHTARGDCYMTIQVLQKMIGLVNESKRNL